MEKEFIPYQQALALKELGFDEPCFGYYHDKRLTGVNKWDRKDFEFHILSKKEVTATTVEIVIAPLYQQAFRWFREKYNLFVQVNIHTYFIYDISNDEFKMIKQYDKLTKTYEEAELECLKKLIELCKK